MSPLLLSTSLIAAGIAMLIASSFLLTITIEDLGKRGRFSDRFTGAVISPLFTALPELVVIIFALVLVGKESGAEIAAGTIIGEPFMVSALGFPAVALALFIAGRKGRNDQLDPALPLTLIFLGAVFPIMLIPSFFRSLLLRVFIAAVLVSLYFLFLRFVRGERNEGEMAEELRIGNRIILVAAILSGLALLFAGSAALVRGIDSVSIITGVNQELVTILLVPIGTIVPETMNAIIWASRNKTNLSIGAIAGEEVFFVTLFPALGILASQWIVTRDGIIAVSLTSILSVAIGIVMYRFREAVHVFIVYLLSLIIFLVLIY